MLEPKQLKPKGLSQKGTRGVSVKSVNNCGFGDFLVFEGTLCENPAVQCQKLGIFCNFGLPESVLTICFAFTIFFKPCSKVKRGGFSLKPVKKKPGGFKLVSKGS